MRFKSFVLFLILFSCGVESEEKVQVIQTGVFEKAFIEQPVNAFLLDSILYSGGNRIFHLNGELVVNTKSELFSVVLDQDPLINTNPTIIASSFGVLSKDELYECSVKRIDDSLIVCWESGENCLRIANPIDSILRH